MPDYRGRRTLGDARPLPALWWEDGPPDPPEEGPEVWCHHCRWDHPVGVSHVYGVNQPCWCDTCGFEHRNAPCGLPGGSGTR